MDNPQPNELRRGNYILYLGELYVITGFREEGAERRIRVYFSTLDGKVKNAKTLNWIEAIPLTKEIMDESGFKTSGYNRLLSNGQFDMIGWIGGCYAWHELDANSEPFVIVPLKHVHQIQNLYSSLSNGRELEIKFPSIIKKTNFNG